MPSTGTWFDAKIDCYDGRVIYTAVRASCYASAESTVRLLYADDTYNHGGVRTLTVTQRDLPPA